MKGRPFFAATEKALERWTRTRGVRLLLWPAITALLSLSLLSTLLWRSHQHDVREHRRAFEASLDSAALSVENHLRDSGVKLRSLAEDFAAGPAPVPPDRGRVAGRLPVSLALFRVQGNSVLRLADGSSAWGADFVPKVGDLLGQGSLECGLPSFRLRTVESSGRKLPCLTISVPLPRGAQSGFLAGLFPVDTLLEDTIPRHVLESHRVSLLLPDAGVVWSSEPDQPLAPALEGIRSLSPLAPGVTLRLERFDRGMLGWEILLLALLFTGLTWVGSYGLFLLSRYAVERRKSEEDLQRERDNLRNVLEAMVDGVAVVSSRYEIQYVNSVLVKDFGEYLGKRCHEYFHGSPERCSWCMMADVLAGKEVYSEQCYPRNGRTYELFDTRVRNADGSLSKLKIYRDVSEQVQASAALRESQRRFQQLFEQAADALFLCEPSGSVLEANEAASEALGYSRGELKRMRLQDLSFEQDREGSLEPSRGRPPAGAVRTRYRRADGSSLPVEVRVGYLESEGKSLVLAAARDDTQRNVFEETIREKLAAEQAAASQARQRLEEAEALYRVSTALLQKITVQEILELVCGEAQRLTGATGSGVLFIEGSEFRLSGSTGSPLPSLDRLPVVGSFGELAVNAGEPVLIADTSAYDLGCYRDPRPRALIVTPLRVHDRIIGVLDVAGTGVAFRRDDLRVLSHFANQAAIAIETARLRQRAEQLAVVEERQRLARDLHDSVAQALYSVVLFADAARMALAAGKEATVGAHLQELRTQAREAMMEMRLLIFELHPPSLEREGLLGALQMRLATVEARSGLRAELVVEGAERRLPTELEEALYRFVQEALNNVARHAKATQTRVRAVFGSSAVEVEVTDDGVGFDPLERRKKGGMGMASMRERLERIGGRLHVESSPGAGSRVVAEVKG